jgi:hypothetical protein
VVFRAVYIAMGGGMPEGEAAIEPDDRPRRNHLSAADEPPPTKGGSALIRPLFGALSWRKKADGIMLNLNSLKAIFCPLRSPVSILGWSSMIVALFFIFDDHGIERRPLL